MNSNTFGRNSFSIPSTSSMNYENIFMFLVLLLCLLAISLKSYYIFSFSSRSRSDYEAKNNVSIQIDEKISSCSTNCSSNSTFALRDFYIYGSYNSAILGPYNYPTVSLQALIDVIKHGVRFLDFEIYSSYADNKPMVSSSIITTKCGQLVQTQYMLPFRSCMEVIQDYAFTNSGCMNYTDPLIVNLRLKTCQPEVAEELATIFRSFSSLMLGPEYSFNDNKSNFGATPIKKLKGKICLFVESENMEYTSVPSFMEFVNLSKPTEFVKLLPFSSFSLISSLDEFKDFNKRNITIAVPDSSQSDPNNVVIESLQNAGVQIVTLMFWKKDSALQHGIEYFQKNQSAFVLKPEELRYNPIVIPNPKPQKKELSFEARPLDTGIPNIQFKI